MSWSNLQLGWQYVTPYIVRCLYIHCGFDAAHKPPGRAAEFCHPKCFQRVHWNLVAPTGQRFSICLELKKPCQSRHAPACPQNVAQEMENRTQHVSEVATFLLRKGFLLDKQHKFTAVTAAIYLWKNLVHGLVCCFEKNTSKILQTS